MVCQRYSKKQNGKKHANVSEEEGELAEQNRLPYDRWER